MFGLKGKILTTLALFAKSITLGCGSNFFPSVIEEMRIKLNTDQETIMQIHKIFANASLGGTLGGIIVFRIIRRQLGTMYILVGISVLMIMIPNSPNVDYFIIFVAILGVLVGLIVPGQIVWTMEMWQKMSTPILQALMFCFSVGQALPEYITAPFLMVHPLEINGKDNILNETNVEIVELPPMVNDSETIDLLEFKNFTQNILPNASNQTQEFSNIHIPFAIVGVMSFFNAWFERLLFKDFTYEPPPPPGAKGKPDENNDEANKEDEPENQAAKSTNLQNQDPPPDASDDENDSNNSSEDECSASDENESDADNDSLPAKESDENDNEPTEDEIEEQSKKLGKQFLEKIPMKAVKAPLGKSAIKMREKARTIMIQNKVIATTKAAKGDANAAKGDLKTMTDVVKVAKGEKKVTKGDTKSALGEKKSFVIDTTKSNVEDTKNINVSKTTWKSAAAKAKNMKAFQKKRNKTNIKKGMKLMKMAKDKMDKEKEKSGESDLNDEENEEIKTESYETEKEEKGTGREDEKCEKEYEEKENDDDESEHEDETTDDCDIPLLTKGNDASDAESEISIEFCKDVKPGQDTHSNSPSIAEDQRSYSTQDTEITGPFSEEEKENDKTGKEKSISDSEETESTKEDATSRTTVIEKDKTKDEKDEVDEKFEKNEAELQSKQSKNTSNQNDEIKDKNSVEDNNAKTPEDDSKNNEEVKAKEEQEEEDEEGLKGKVQGCIKKLKAAKKIVVGVWKMVTNAEGRKAIYVLALSSCVFGAYAAIEKCSKETLSKLAQEGNLKLNEEGGALVLQGFTTAFMWGRFAGMVVALILSPFTIMCLDLSLIFLGNFTIIFGASFDMWAMLGGCVLLGLGLSTFYAGLFTYLCGQIPFTDVIGAIIVVSSTIATNFYSEWIEKFIGGDSQKLTTANYISGIVCTIGFKIIYSIAKPKKIPQDLEDVVIA